jgi:hypothetical protein
VTPFGFVIQFLDAGRSRLAGLGRCVVPVRPFGDPGAVERGTPNCSSNSRLSVAGMIAPIDRKVSATPWCNRFVFSLVSSVSHSQQKYVLAKRWREWKAKYTTPTQCHTRKSC